MPVRFYKREAFWSIVAILFLIVAVILLIRGHIDATFVAATLGILSWFISMRQRLRQAIPVADDAPETELDHDGDENES